MEANQADVKFVADLGAKATTPTLFKDEKEHFIVVPAGMEIRSVRDFQFAEPPLTKQGTITVRDVPSFAMYFNRFADADSLIFADPEAHSFTGILDYHCAAAGAARHTRHKVSLTLEKTKRWKVWHGANKKAMGQEEFATFIEDNLAEIWAPEDDPKMPAAADMLEVSRTLEASTSHTFKSATNLKNGQRNLVYQEQVNGAAGPGGEMQIPDEFCVRVPIFLGQKAVVVRCRLRFRINGGRLSMWYDMLLVDEILRVEFETARKGVEEGCGRTVILGAA